MKLICNNSVKIRAFITEMMHQTLQPYRKSQEFRETHNLLSKYYNNFYPFELIIKMLKMGKTKSLLQYRNMGLQPSLKESYPMKRKFNRIIDQSLKKELIENDIMAIHCSTFSPTCVETYIHNEEMNEFLIFTDFNFSTMQHTEISRNFQEIVFDIDLTDYDRFCPCQGFKLICDTCWLHMEGTCLILKDILTNRYGIDEKNMMWVFSGGKGMHCIINDKSMLQMDIKQRMNIYNDIRVDKCDEYHNHLKKMNNGFYSPSLIKKLRKLFLNQVLIKRNLLFHSNEFVDHLLKKLKRHYPLSFYSIIQKSWTLIHNDIGINVTEKSIKKWESLIQLENKSSLTSSLYLILSLYYPMIDRNPLEIGHLIKLPFSIHVSTMKISLPIDHNLITNYDVFQSFCTLKTLLISNGVNNHEYLIEIFENAKSIFEKWLLCYDNY
jgi:DNA primase catalytic subunit